MNRFVQLLGALLHPCPQLAARALALVRGSFYLLYYRLAHRGVCIDFPLFAYARVHISGPGRVRIGAFCSVHCNTFKGLSIITMNPQARVTIGRRTNLGGLTVRCAERICIGPRTMTAMTLVQDFLWHPAERHTARGSAASGPLAVAPVEVGAHVWLSAQSVVLAGTALGADVVVAAGAVCHGVQAPPYTLVGGNPAKQALPIAPLVHWRGRER